MSARRFPIEAGHIMMFARAIGDPNPIYYAGADLVSDRAHVVAPPTFVDAVMHYDPVFPYRPRIGEPWFGSGREPSSGPPPAPAAGPGGTGGTSFHASTDFEYFGQLRPGDILDVRERPGSSWERRGSRGGRLWFTSFVQDFMREDVTVVRNTTVLVTTEEKVDPARAPAKPARSAARLPSVPLGLRPASYPVASVRSSDIAIGEVREQVLVENLTRAQIMLYAGASGDFSPQHTDEVWNTKVAGYPSVFGQGMLTMGMSGRILTDWFGNDALRAFGMRFATQVWPGDTVIGRVEVVGLEPTERSIQVELKVEARNDQGEMVTTGTARVELAD